MKNPKPRYKGELVESTLHSKKIGKPNDGMAELLSAMDSDIDKIEEAGFSKSAKMLRKEVNSIDSDWDKLWNRVVKLSRDIIKIS